MGKRNKLGMVQMTGKWTTVAIMAALLIPCVLEAKTVERVAAVAGDEVITLNDIRREGVLRYLVKGKDLHDIDYSPDREEELEALTKELVQVRLIAREAKKNNIHVGDREVNAQLQQMYMQSGQGEETYRTMMASEGIDWDDYRAYLRGEIEGQYVVRSALAGQVSPSEVDVIACAQEKLPDAENSVIVSLSQIQIPEIDVDSKAGLGEDMAKIINPVWWNSLDKAQAQVAEGVHELASSSPDRFVEYVKKYSSGRSAERDGVLGQFSTGDLTKDFASVFTLNAGEIAPLISTKVGYHIVKVDEVTHGESEQWKATVNQCRELIIMQESQRLINSWLEDLFVKNYVSILVNAHIDKE